MYKSQYIFIGDVGIKKETSFSHKQLVDELATILNPILRADSTVPPSQHALGAQFTS